jgi:tungstate transport system ATP-binding protein
MSPRPTTPLFSFRGLRKCAADGALLLDIADLVIPAQSCTLLSGGNGVGKTTLLKIIAGLEPPDAAEVEFDGIRLPWRAARPHCARHVIYLHQQPYLFDRDVVANVAYGLRGLGLARAEIARRVEQALAAAELGHLGARNARELSGGEQQRVALCRALVLAPKLLLLDEPFANLDAAARQRTTAVLAQLKAQHIALVLTSHEPLSLAALTDYHYELNNGRLAAATRGASVVRMEEVSARRARGMTAAARPRDELH